MTLARRPFLALSTLALVAVARPAWAADGTQRRDLAGYTTVAVSGPFEVTLRAAEREAVELQGDDGVLALVETTSEGSGSRRSLRIAMKKEANVRLRAPIRVRVDYVRLDAISVAGDGSVRGAALRSERMAVSIAGSGSVELDGRSGSLDASIVGSGRLEAARLTAQDVSVNIAGSGDARVHADGTLAVSIAGSGNVVHSGAAAPAVSIVGSGRVRRGT